MEIDRKLLKSDMKAEGCCGAAATKQNACVYYLCVFGANKVKNAIINGVVASILDCTEDR